MTKGLRSCMILFLGVTAALLLSSAGSPQTRKDATEPRGLPQSFADLAESVKPAVVNVSTVATVKGPGNPFTFFFGPERQDPFGDIPNREMKQKSLGSGFIIDNEGYIVTNNHVVQRADEITVRLIEGREFKAKVVGRDPKTDIALIKISSPAKDLPVLPLGDSDKMRVGDWVLAVGNPFGLGHTVTQGIISATGRVIGTGPYDNFLQTDAPINPGNSGGPLVNLRGEVVGITTAMLASGHGIGFAIPSNMARTIVSQLRDRGKVVRGWIGVSVQNVTPEITQSFGLKEPKGTLVGDVVDGSPADSAGIKRGDIIVRFDEKEVKSVSDLPRIVAETPVGKTVSVGILRQGKEMLISLKVRELPEERVAPAQTGSVPDTSLGLTVEAISERWQKQFRLKERTGVLVVNVIQGGPADEAGIRTGDIIKEVDRIPVTSPQEYASAVEKARNNASVLFLLKRGAKVFYTSLKTRQ